jgi:molybdate transport system permease protein
MTPSRPLGTDRNFYLGLGVLGGSYILLIVGLLVADVLYASPNAIRQAASDPLVRSAIRLSLLSCTITTILALWVAVPLGYLLSRTMFRGKVIIDTILDVPIVLPPLVVGISLLILFQLPAGRAVERVIPVAYHVPAIILAQFAVATAFAVRTMQITFDQIDPRAEQVALTLGCTRAQAFWLVTLPAARKGVLAAATLAWARSLGEFGPVQVFAGAVPGRTVVLPTAIYFEQELGRLESALAISLMMMFLAGCVLVLTRILGLRDTRPV